MDYLGQLEDAGDGYGLSDEGDMGQETERFADDIYQIARSQGSGIRRSGSLEELSVERYASNWDDLEEYCTELSSRPGLSETGENMADVEVEYNHVNGVEHSRHSDGAGTDSSEIETERSENSIEGNCNNNNANRSDDIIVPPPRKKKMARLGKAGARSAENPKLNGEAMGLSVGHIAQGISVSDEKDLQRQTENGSGEMDMICCNGENVNSCEQSEISTETGSLESSRSESYDEDKSITKPPLTNGKAVREETSVRHNNQRNNELNDCVHDIRNEENRDEENKNAICGVRTSQTGLHSDNGSLACAHVHDGQHSDRDELKFTTNNDNGDVNLAAEVNHADDREADCPDRIPNGSDSTSNSREGRTVELSDATLQAGDIEVTEDSSHKYRSEVLVTPEYSRDSDETVERADGCEDREVCVNEEDDEDKCSQESKKSTSIYVDSADLQAVDAKLVVKPAVRRLSTSCDPTSEDDKKARDLKKSKHLRRHSTAAIGHVEDLSLTLPSEYQEHSTGRCKSVTDLSQSSEDSRKTRQHVQRNRSLSRKVLSAVGKLSLRVRHAFSTKPGAEFDIGENIDTATMQKSDGKQPQSSKAEKRHTSKLYIEVGGDYSESKTDSNKSRNERLETETVHSYPDEQRNPKPKGRFSTIFGLGGKKWHTISSLPKLFHLKRKSKDKKGDKMSTVSEFEAETISSVASAPVRGRNRFLIANGRYASNAKDKIAKDKQYKHYDADSPHDLPTFISLEEYRRRAEEAEYRRQLAEAEKEKRQNGLGKRSLSLPYLDTSEEEEQGYGTVKYDYGTNPPPRPDRRRTRPRPESYDDTRRREEEIRYRQDRDPRRREQFVTDNVDTIEKSERRRRYKRREKIERPPSRQETVDSHDEIDKSTMKVDYGYDIYHFQDHPRLSRPQSTSDLHFSSMADFNETPNGRYSTQPRVRHSVAEPEDRGRRRQGQSRDRNSIAVANGRVPERQKRERIPRPKSLSALPADDSLSSDTAEVTNTQRRRRNPHRRPSPSPSPPPRRHDPSPEVDPIQDAIAKHLKHERGPLARRKLERKRSIESGSMQRLKESFMAKRIWESVYDQLLKDLSPNSNGADAPQPPKKPVKT